MEDVVWYRKPLLSEPVAILAFEGWSDAGNTATGCIENLSSTYDVEPFAELNSDSYYNYQMRRPIVEVKDFGERNFHWPQTSFYSIEDPENMSVAERLLSTKEGKEVLQKLMDSCKMESEQYWADRSALKWN